MKNHTEEREREALIQGYLEGSLTDDESIRLRSLLQQDPAIADLILTGLRDDLLIRGVVAEWVVASAAKTIHRVRPLHEILERVGMILDSLRRNAWATPAFGATAFAVLLIFFWIWCFGPTAGTPVLAEVQGTGIVLERSRESLAPTPGMSLRDGDILRTSEGATAVVGFAPENTRITILPGTEFKLRGGSHNKRFDLNMGKLEASVARQRPFRPMILKTPHAEARVIGTRFALTVTTNSTRLDVTEGKVRFTRDSDSKFVKVSTGHYAIAAADSQLASLPFTGGLLRMWWSGVQGNTFAKNPRLRNPPDGREVVPDFELAIAETNAVAVHVCGYVHPPVTGNYRFWLEKPPMDFAKTGYAQLAMSPTEDPSEAVTIAQTATPGNGVISPYQAVGATKAPPPIPLVAGRRYYLQANLFIKKGKAELSVFWLPPGQERRVLSSEFLSPWEGK